MQSLCLTAFVVSGSGQGFSDGFTDGTFVYMLPGAVVMTCIACRDKLCKSFCIFMGWKMGREEGFQPIHTMMEALRASTWLVSPSMTSAVPQNLLQRL